MIDSDQDRKAIVAQIFAPGRVRQDDQAVELAKRGGFA